MGSGSSSSLEPPGRRRTRIRSKRDRDRDRAQSPDLIRGPRSTARGLFSRQSMDCRVKPGNDNEVSWTLKMRAIKPIERLVPVSYMHYCTYKPSLSTWSSSTVLKGMLVLRCVSRLDAFSGYPVRT